ncbi:SDR family NAD(P)-dependent oxidoreductase [Anaeroselena agilis]|uniref:SDR family oxidoreductase n=1 Tax=Anaeroselena agilis TaxID=3063788 RepID=A0ABU3P2N2_9FIRM|nr:SDR family oxidoreductase [Selenomonadales bacterium 4137-cl]
MDNRKVALITGGGTGIGRAVALRLAAQGIDIVVNYSRSEKDALDTAAAVREAGVGCLIEKADVAADDQVRVMVDNTVRRFGRLDYLVNSAGTTRFVDAGDLDGLTGEFWDDIMAVNVKGAYFACRACRPHLKKTGGAIVNITSIAGITGRGSSIAYAASKAAAISLTKSLAQVFAPEIRVNSVAPGIVLTRWVAGREDHIARLGAGTPLGRVCSPEDVADVVAPLLLTAGMVTGQTIVVDGGAIL